MNLLCPNCQKMLQVPEQYAGQQMKCPMCAGAFTVPALPQMPVAASMPVAPPPVPTAPPPPPMPEATAPRREKAASMNAGDDAPRHAPADIPPGMPPAGYAKIRSFTLNPNVIPLIAPLSLGLVFVLLFFSWVAMAPGGDTAVTQNGWQIAFGSSDPDTRWLRAYQQSHSGFTKETIAPGFGGLMILFLLVYLLLAVPLSILCVLVARKAVALPPALAPLIPWRSGLLALAITAGFFLLLLQIMLGVSLEGKARDVAESYVASEKARPDQTPDEKLITEYRAGQYVAEFGLYYTVWFKLVLLLMFLALVGALLDYWLEKRGSEPLPRIDLLS